MEKESKKTRFVRDARKFLIGDLCNVNGREGTFIIQGVNRTDDRVIITLGNVDKSELIQFNVDSTDVDVISLKISITLPNEGAKPKPVNTRDIDNILSFFKRRGHHAFKEAFIKFCGVFKVDYEHARPLLLCRVFSWDLHTMFDKNEKAWKIPRTGRMYVERSVIDTYETAEGPITLTYKPKVVSSEVAMLTHQRKIIEALVDASSTQLDVLRMTPPASSNAPVAFSRKKDSSKAASSSSRKTLETEGYGMIDFQGDIAQVRKVVGSGQPVKLRVVFLGGKVIGAHKNQVTDINLLNHAFEALMKRRRIVEGVVEEVEEGSEEGGEEGGEEVDLEPILPDGIVREHIPQPIMPGEIDTLAKLSLVQVIPSTSRFNIQHFTDQLIPAGDKMSQDAYARMVMCILANEYLTNVNESLADVFDIKENLMVTFKKLVFSVMYSDLELRLQTPQDMMGHDRSTRGPTQDAFIKSVTEMNQRRLLKANEMKEITLFIKLFDECEEHLSEDKDIMEEEIRDFFRKKLRDWEIHMVERVLPPKEGQPSLPGTIESILRDNPGKHPSDLFRFSMTPAQQAAVLQMAASVPIPVTHAVRGVKVGDRFINRDFGAIKIIVVDANVVWFEVESTSERRSMPTSEITNREIVVPYPNISSIYQSSNSNIKFRVISVNSRQDIGIRDLYGNISSITFEEFSHSRLVDDSHGKLSRPTKKRRHKRRNTRKGG